VLGQVPSREENFPYAVGDTLSTRGWSQNGTGAYVLATSPGLIYTGYAGSDIGNAAALANAGQDIYRTFPAESSVVYAAALLNLSAAGTGDHFFGTFYNNTYRGRVFVKSSSPGFVFGLDKGTGTVSYEGTVRNFGETYLIVIKYKYGPGPAVDDTVSLFINPTIGSPEPSPTIGPIVDAAQSDLIRLNAVYLRQGGGAIIAPTLTIDGIRASTSWATTVAAGPPSNSSDIIGAGNETSNINYANYQSSNIATTSDAVRLWSFTIRDGGGSADADLKPTSIDTLIIDQGSSNGIADWTTDIRQAALFDGTKKAAGVDLISATSLAFRNIKDSIIVPDGGSKTIDLYVTFRSVVNDNQQFQFRITGANAKTPANSGSYSTYASFSDLTSSVSADANRIEVTADQLGFIQQPTDVSVNKNIFPAVTVEAKDVLGNRDLDFATNILITATGAPLVGSPVSGTPASGLSTFSMLSFSDSLSGTTLTAAKSGGGWDVVSNAFNVVKKPLISVVSSLTLFGNQVFSTSSTPQSYTVSGDNLTNDIVITPPSNFEISLSSSSGFGTSPITLTQTGGSVPSTTMYVRFSPQSADGANSGNVMHTSTGATPEDIGVSGNAISTEPSTQSSISFGTTTFYSMVVNFTGGNGNRRIVVARAGSAVSFVPIDGIQMIGVNSDFSLATDQGSGNKIVYDGIDATVTMTGLSPLTTYYLAVYEYNIGTGTSENYNTTSPGTGSQATTRRFIISNGTSGGNWSSTATWVGAIVPTQSDSVIVTGSDKVVLDATASCYSIYIASSAKLYTNIALPISIPAYLRVYGSTIQVDGTLGDKTEALANDALGIEFTGNVTLKGSGTIKPARIRPVSNAQNSSFTFDANATLNYNGTTGTGGAAIYTELGTSNNIIINVNSGKVLSLVDLGRISTNADVNTNGNASTTINIDGTVDISQANSLNLKVVAGKTSALNVTGTLSVGEDLKANGGGVTTVTVDGSGVISVAGMADFRLPAANVTGTGSFTLLPTGTLIIGSPEGISASGATGQIQTATRNFAAGAVYDYRGTASQITGNGLPSSIKKLRIENSSGVTLTTSPTVSDTVHLVSGDLDLNGNTITLGPLGYLRETTGNTIFGTSGVITAKRKLTSPDILNDIAGLGVCIGSLADLDSTIITRGHATQGGASIRRYFDISPTFNSGLNATLVFKYNGGELAEKDETSLQLWNSTDGGTNWVKQGGTVDTLGNTIALSNVDGFSRWTATDASHNLYSTFTFSVSSGWNMVSVPVTAPNYAKTILFPSAQSNAFTFQSGYVAKDTLKNGPGYWLKFESNQNVQMYGMSRNSDSIDVRTGWNMIGSISNPISVGDITTSNGVSIVSPFYQYQNGYLVATDLLPGKAYWVKTNADGKLYLNNSVGKSIEKPGDVEQKE
jgi:hypothetical protein